MSFALGIQTEDPKQAFGSPSHQWPRSTLTSLCLKLQAGSVREFTDPAIYIYIYILDVNLCIYMHRVKWI